MTTSDLPGPADDGMRIGTRPIPEFLESRDSSPRGARLEAIRLASVAYRDRFLAGGRIKALRTHPIAATTCPTRFVFDGAAIAPTVPRVLLISRLLIVQYTDLAGRARTLLWEPTILEGAAEAPFLAQAEERLRRLPGGSQRADSARAKYCTTLERALAVSGVDPAAVDYVSFGHLQAQDPRLVIGTTEPWADGLAPRAPMFANARLIVQRREAATFASVHPMQWAWYVDGGMDDLLERSLVLLDGDLELGDGVALLATPGSTDGHQTLALNTPDGIWVVSHNGVALDNWQPQLSKVPGVRAHADFFNREVVPHANTIEDSLDQYDSMVKEKTLASPSCADPSWLQILPARELAGARRHWPVLPTYVHGDIAYGTLDRSTEAPAS